MGKETEQIYYEVDLPQLPDDILDSDPESILKRTCTFDRIEYGYGSFEANPELYEFLQPYYKTPIIVRYQLVLNDLPKHTDFCDQDYKCNYIITPGGDNVITTWYKQDRVLAYTQFESQLWYKFNVTLEHDVINVKSPRVSVTVKET